MVSLWPWAEDNSPASFEKALAALSIKITNSQTQLDGLRHNWRRRKALWTIYSAFVYLLVLVILLVLVGWQNWTAIEYTVVAGTPLLIYLIRTGIARYYAYRVDAITQRLEDRKAERAKTIDKLKSATRYNSTQELLEKYGGAPSKPKTQPPPTSTPAKDQKDKQQQKAGRTSMGPPPTANIGRPNQVPSQPLPLQPVSKSPAHGLPLSPASAPAPQVQAEFAPNAFSVPTQYARGGNMSMGGRWYDRVLDVLLGEDETSPKNRIILICHNCRLVNGQAPPGTKALAELGTWKCFGCGELNGEEDEATKAVKEMKEMISSNVVDEKTTPHTRAASREELAAREELIADDEDVEDESEGDTIEVTKPKRGRPKGSKNKT